MKKTLSALTLMLAFAAGSALAADANTTTPVKGGTPPMMHGGEHHFKELDTNGDGFISKAEWTAKGDKMFAEIDANHDGKISPEEMKAYHDAKFAEMEKHRAERGDRKDGVVVPGTVQK